MARKSRVAHMVEGSDHCIDPKMKALLVETLNRVLWEFHPNVMAVNIQVLYRDEGKTRAVYQPILAPIAGHERFDRLIKELFDDVTRYQRANPLLGTLLVGARPSRLAN